MSDWMTDWLTGWMNEWMNEWVNEWVCLLQLKSSLSKAFSRGRPRGKKTKSVRSAGEAWSDTETDDVLAATETRSGALSMPNSPSLNTSRLRSAVSSASTPSPSRNAALHSPPPTKSVIFVRLLDSTVITLAVNSKFSTSLCMQYVSRVEFY